MGSCITPELLAELDIVLEDSEDQRELFDDFTRDIDEMQGSKFAELSPTASEIREAYLKERRVSPNADLPDTVEEIKK